MIAIQSRAMPLFGWGLLWACNIAMMQGVMRLVAGPAAAGRLARQSRSVYAASAANSRSV